MSVGLSPMFVGDDKWGLMSVSWAVMGGTNWWDGSFKREMEAKKKEIMTTCW